MANLLTPLPTLDPLIAVPAIAALEGTGVPLPGCIYIAGVGLTLGHDWPRLVLLALLYGLAYTAGALVQYGAGRLLGPTVLAWLPGKQRMLTAGWLRKYGPAVVLWTRPLAAGNYVSAPAGMMRMPWLPFVLYTLLGICPWIAATLAAGDLLGRLLQPLAPYALPAAGVAAAAALVGAAWQARAHRTAAARG